jgi:hypothetical protein
MLPPSYMTKRPTRLEAYPSYVELSMWTWGTDIEIRQRKFGKMKFHKYPY